MYDGIELLLLKRIYVSPQWQGGADKVTYRGAQEAAELYLVGVDLTRMPVRDDGTGMEKKRGIVAFEALRKQMRSALEILQREAPVKLLAVGGGCDADVPFIAYLNERYGGDMAVLWLDAHGDLNAPQESVTGLFYGMPLRAAMDAACFGLMDNALPVTPGQVVHVGARDLDRAEEAFVRSAGISRLTIESVRSDPRAVRRAVEEKGLSRLYVHLDLDVLDPSAFPNTPLPVEGGLMPDELMGILEGLEPAMVGLGVYEYAACCCASDLMESLFDLGLRL